MSLSAAAFRICEQNTSSHPEGQRFKSPWKQKQKIFLLQKKIKIVFFISIKYVNLCQISWKKDMIFGNKNATTRT